MNQEVLEIQKLLRGRRVAIVHDWLTGMRGGEAILDVICELFPEADLFTLLQTDFVMSSKILNGRRVHTSYLQKLMGWKFFRQGYRKLLPLFPHAVSTLDLSAFDVVLSNTHCVAKGVKVKPGAVHISYVSTPMRYVWDMYDDYFGPGKAGLFTRLMAALVRKPLQKWDQATNDSLNFILANSNFVRERIRNFWKREAEVVHPFVYTERFPCTNSAPDNYFLIVSALAPYKRVDLAVEAFRRLGLPLKIIGKGQEEARLRELVMGVKNVEFLGSLSNTEVARHFRQARALIFPGLEDFGITPLEAMSSGRPVIAYGRGGLLDTVTEKTGVFFPEQTPESLMAAVVEFNKKSFSPADCRARAEEFSKNVFVKKYLDVLRRAL